MGSGLCLREASGRSEHDCCACDARRRALRAGGCPRTQLDTTVDALALACALAQPFDAMVLSGAACVDHLRSNFAATEVLARLDAATVDELMDACRADPEEYWAERSALAWN